MSEKLVRGDQTAFYSLMRKKCINHKDYSDVMFVVGPQRQLIYGHRCILAARSEVLRKMFSQLPNHAVASREVPITMPDVRPEVFLTVLDYVYSNCCTLTFDLAPDVLSLSVEYTLDGLRRICSKFLLEGICIETACDVLEAAVSYAQPEMLQKALDFATRNASELLRNTRFHELSAQALAALLRSDSLEADELEIIAAVKKWSKSNSIVTNIHSKEVASSVVPLIRLPLLSPDELKRIEEENKKEAIIPVEQLADAWKFHALKEKTPSSYSTCLRAGTKQRESHSYLPAKK